MPSIWTMRHDRLRAQWPGVDPEAVCAVLASIDAAGTEADRAGVEAALVLAGADAASALMGPVAAAFGSVAPSERVGVLHAVDALIRAGGDPAPALAVLAEALADARTVKPACEALHRAALAGGSLAPVREALAKASCDDSVRAVMRLEALQRRGLHDDLRALAAIYARRLGNLHGALGLVEESLLAEAGDEAVAARTALAECERAGTDLYRCWTALLPVVRRHLEGDHGERSAAALAQIEVAIGRSAEFDATEAAARAVPLLEPTLEGLTALLGGEDRARMVAAKAIEVLLAMGCSAFAVRHRIERAMRDPRVEVRSACSRALSAALARTGEETGLAPGQSHRRTFAMDDTPLDARKARCPHCGATEAVLLYESRDRGNTWDETTAERKCAACGIYTVERFGL